MDLETVTAGLLEDVREFICRYVRLSPDEADAIAVWVLHTHALEAARVSPYLHLTSVEPGSGKSLLLEVLELIVARPWLCAAATTAALVRRIDRDTPTLLLDEADASFKRNNDYSQALRQILNAGYRQNATYEMCVGEGANISTRTYKVFCPKAIAGLNELPDTVSARSIPIRMKPLAPNETVDEFIREDVETEAKRLRTRVEEWGGLAVESLRGARPNDPAQLRNRTKEISRPLLAIADLAGEDWPERLRDSLVNIHTGSGEYEERSTGLQLLSDVYRVFEEIKVEDRDRERDRITSNELCTRLAKMDGQPWAEISHGQKITPNTLARILRRYGIAPASIRVSSGTPKGYFRSQFEDAFARYLDHGTKENNGPASAGQLGDALDEVDGLQSTPQQRFDSSFIFGKFTD